MRKGFKWLIAALVVGVLGALFGPGLIGVVYGIFHMS